MLADIRSLGVWTLHRLNNMWVCAAAHVLHDVAT